MTTAPIDISASLFDVSARSGFYDVWLAKTDGAPAAAAWVANPPEFRSVLSTRHLLIARAADGAAVCVARIRKNPKRGAFKAVVMTAEGVTYEGAEIDAKAVGAPRVARFDDDDRLLVRYGTDWKAFWLDRNPRNTHAWTMVLIASRLGIDQARLLRVSLSAAHHLLTWLDVHDGQCRAAMHAAQSVVSGDPPSDARLAELRTNLVVRSVGSDKKIKVAADAMLDLLTAASAGASMMAGGAASVMWQMKEAADRGLIQGRNGEICDLVRAHVSLPQVTLAAMVRAEQLRTERRR